MRPNLLSPMTSTSAYLSRLTQVSSANAAHGLTPLNIGLALALLLTSTLLLIGLGYIVTLRRRLDDLEQQRRQQEPHAEYYRLLANNARDLIYRVRLKPDMAFEYVSPSATAMTGYTPEDHYADPQLGFKLVHPEDQPLLQMASAQPNKPVVLRWVRRDGSILWTEQNNTPILDDGGELIALEGIARDITERKEAEAALREAQARYQLLTELTFEGIVLHDNGVVFDANPAFLRMFGYELAEIVGQQVIGLIFAAESHTMVRQNVCAQYAEPYEAVAVRKDGRRFPVEIEARQMRPNLRVASIRDMTQRKQATTYALENERLKSRFQQERERNDLIQRIISTLSHDLRTTLAVISSSRDMLSHYYDRLTDDRRQEKLNTIGRQVQFALELLDDTVQMARGDLHESEFRPAPVNLGVLCRVSIEEIHAANGTHRLVFDNVGQVETVSVDEVLVSRILLNLLANAIKYSPADSEVRLELDMPADSVVLRVVDQGAGIHADEMEHIFDPFYRAPSARALPGTGLGLSIVKSCVTRHRGRITVDSQVGAGSTFIVELPAQQA